MVQTSHVLYGEGTKKAENWREDMMGCVWEQGSLVMMHRLGPYLRRHRRGPKREALKSLRDYVGKRVAMTDYPAFRENLGIPLDESGSVAIIVAPCGRARYSDARV